MSPSKAEPIDSGSVEAHLLLAAVTRLKEVRRRYVTEAGEGTQFILAEDRLDSLISDIEGWLKPGGVPVEIGDLDLRLAAVEEMIEAVGFPGYARVIASVRGTLKEPVEDSQAEQEPPPPQRYQPPAGPPATRSTSESGMDEWEIRAAIEAREKGREWRNWSIVIVCCMAAAALFFFLQAENEPDQPDLADLVVPQELEVSEATAIPAPPSDPAPVDMEETLELRAETLERFTKEIHSAQNALSSQDLDLALKHFVAAATIDRHHWRLSHFAELLIDSLLKEADVAFDDSQWDLAAERVEVARRIARGLYFDLTEIDQTAQKHSALTRFEDITPADRPELRQAVGHSVRVTHENGEVLFGRLEALQNGNLVLEVHTGVEGGGVRFEKTIPVTMIRELRVFETERPSETVLGP